MNDHTPLRFRARQSTPKTSSKHLYSGVLALATTLAVLVPSAAQANSYVSPDTAKDVVKFDSKTSNNYTKVPDRAEGDILSSAVVHGKRRVRMAMRLDELTQAGEGATFFWRVGTKRMTRVLYIVTGSSKWQGVGYFQKDSGKGVKCRGIGWSIDYGADVVRASVPRKCLGRPKWVHVGLAAGTATTEDPVAYLDDARTNGYIGQWPKWGPRVFR